MKNIYYIGRFQFDSYAEYKKGLEDIKKIKYISDEVDVREPGVALRLYTLIRQKDIKFQSVIGEDYLLYLSDLVADDYKEISDEEPGKAYLENLGGTRSLRKFVGIICIAVALLCFSYFLGSEYLSAQKTRKLQALQVSRDEGQDESSAEQYIAEIQNGAQSQELPQQEEVPVEQTDADSQTIEEEQTESKMILPEYQALCAQNSDMVGWITIPGTVVDYPVLQSTDSSQFYMEHDFYMEEDDHGQIALDTRNRLSPEDSNLILYGHNMKDGTMFGCLASYEDENFLKEHPQIEFNTLYEKRKYDIIAVCLSQVQYKGEDAFRYYNFLNAGTEQEFEDFKRNIADMNIYGGDINMSYEDDLITLSTCNSYVEDGRLFLVARRVE